MSNILDHINDLVKPFLPVKVPAQDAGYYYVKGKVRLPADEFLGKQPPEGYTLEKSGATKASSTAFDKDSLIKKLGRVDRFDYEAVLYLASAIKTAAPPNHRLTANKSTGLTVSSYSTLKRTKFTRKG